MKYKWQRILITILALSGGLLIILIAATGITRTLLLMPPGTSGIATVSGGISSSLCSGALALIIVALAFLLCATTAASIDPPRHSPPCLLPYLRSMRKRTAPITFSAGQDGEPLPAKPQFMTHSVWRLVNQAFRIASRLPTPRTHSQIVPTYVTHDVSLL